jgi:hypothetical protein
MYIINANQGYSFGSSIPPKETVLSDEVLMIMDSFYDLIYSNHESSSFVDYIVSYSTYNTGRLL